MPVKEANPQTRADDTLNDHKTIKDMKKLVDFYNKMDDDDAIRIFGVFGLCLMLVSLFGYLFEMPCWATYLLLGASHVMLFVSLAIMFVKNDFFLHDLTQNDKKK